MAKQCTVQTFVRGEHQSPVNQCSSISETLWLYLDHSGLICYLWMSQMRNELNVVEEKLGWFWQWCIFDPITRVTTPCWGKHDTDSATLQALSAMCKAKKFVTCRKLAHWPYPCSPLTITPNEILDTTVFGLWCHWDWLHRHGKGWNGNLSPSKPPGLGDLGRG